MFSRPIRKALIVMAFIILGAIPLAEADSLSPITVSVPTIAMLRTMTIPASSIGGLVYVSEYATGTDRGGGWFKIKSASCTDDQGYHIALSGSHCAVRQGVEQGFNTDWFGGFGDTVADDSAAMNYATAAACASGTPTNTVLIPNPASNYYVISASHISISCSLTFRGIGNAVKFKCTNASLDACMGGPAIKTISPTIENVSFETNTSVPIGIYMKGWSGAHLTNVGFPKELVGTVGFMTPIQVEATDTLFAYGNYFYSVGIRTKCSANAIGVKLLSTATTFDSGITTEKFFGGEIDSCQGIGLQTDGGIEVFGTIFEETPDTCVKFVDPPTVVTDNQGSFMFGPYFEGCATYNINYAGSRVYWNTDFAGLSSKINDVTKRNLHLGSPQSSSHSERILIPDGTTTPEVGYGNVFYTANSTAKTITNFLLQGGNCAQGGQFIINKDSNTTISPNSNIATKGGANITAGGWYMFQCISGQWQQVF